MRILHHVVFNATPERQRDLAQVGITIQGSGILAFDIFEDDARWTELSEWLNRETITTLAACCYSAQEMAAAEWLYLYADWYHGYPEPDMGNAGYLKVTYDPSVRCEKCSFGKVQRAPFRMKAEPKWGKKGLMMLNWVYDEMFVKPEVFREVFEPFGVQCRPVLNSKGQELKTVVQLDVKESVSFDVDETPFSKCESCGFKKYHPVTRGMMPPLRISPDVAVARSAEYWGHGGNASRMLMVSQSVAAKLIASKVKGYRLDPITNR